MPGSRNRFVATGKNRIPGSPAINGGPKLTVDGRFWCSWISPGNV